MPKFQVTKSKIINAPVDQVFQTVKDLGTWQKWSPWLILEPGVKVNVASDGASYKWEGKRVGSGQMAVTHSVENQAVDYDLEFLKPWKSKAKVHMVTEPAGDHTKVTWKMESQIPIFMFWMKNMMKSFIGMDYERGLNLLKDYVEDGEVHSQLNFLGESQYAGCNYIGIERKCSIAESPKFMEADFTKLMTYTHNAEGFRPHEAFCTYHKWDVVKGRAHYTAGVPYNQLPADVPSEFLKGKVPACKVHTVEHVGPYQHLGNAWSALISMQRNKESKPLKNIHPFETYGNSPKDTAPHDLIARIHFPVR